MGVVININPKNDVNKKPSYDDVLGTAKSLAKENTHDATKQVLTCLAVGKFDALEIDMIISMIASKIKVADSGDEGMSRGVMFALPPKADIRRVVAECLFLTQCRHHR